MSLTRHLLVIQPLKKPEQPLALNFQRYTAGHDLTFSKAQLVSCSPLLERWCLKTHRTSRGGSSQTSGDKLKPKSHNKPQAQVPELQGMGKEHILTYLAALPNPEA